MEFKKRLVIIGLDGIPYGAIKELSKTGVMPQVGKLIEQGTLRKMQSSIPEISSVAWSSIITGKNPGEHGIFGFTDLCPGSYQLSFPNFNDLKNLPFWLVKKDEKSIIMNVPSTYPVRELNGVHISGFISLKFEESVYPVSLIPKLKELDYTIDVDSSKAHKSIKLFLEDLDKTLKARIKAYRYLWQNYDWQNFMLVFTGTDRLGHFLWDAFEDENHKYRKEFLDHFSQIDEVIGEIKDNLKEEDILILLSDHGFELLDENFNVNYLLKENGFLKIKDNSKQNLINIDSSSKAFALDPARIYINLEGKYPQGSVKEEEKDKIIDDLKDIFTSLERSGKKVIRNVYKKEEIYSGPFLESAPDLVLVGNKGFNLKANVNATELYENNIFKGKHSQDDAFVLVNKKCDKVTTDSLSVSNFLELVTSLKQST